MTQQFTAEIPDVEQGSDAGQLITEPTTTEVIFTIRADTNALERIREVGIDLTSLLDDQSVVAEFTGSAARFVSMMYAWCEPQLTRMQINPERFAAGLYGDAFDNAMDAALLELPFFFPKHRRPLVTDLVNRFLEAETQGTERARTVLQSEKMQQAINQALDRAEQSGFAAVEKLTRTTGGDESINSPESSGSTPDH